ncbi:MAG: TetR/AcrR family transcriptional regulator [Acidobacteriota bacterium]
MTRSISLRRKNRRKAHIRQTSSATHFRREPRQERARFTIACILKAAAEVIDEAGWSHASTNRIADRAGVSIGTLYQYFADKEAILRRLVEGHHEAVHGVVGETLNRLDDPGVAIEDAMREMFLALVHLHREDPVLTRVLASEVPHRVSSSELKEEAAAYIDRMARLLRSRQEVRVRDPLRSAHILAITAEALTRWLAHEAPHELDANLLIGDIVLMLSAYLTGGRARREPHAVAAP